MSVLVAKTKGECSQWTGVVVLVDVLCTSTTVCALLRNRKPAVLFCKDTSVAEQLAKQAGDVFSETKLSVSYQPNSPFLAGKTGSGGKAAVLLADETFNDILWRTRQAKRVFLGGFCNFHKLIDLLREQTEDILLVPISQFSSPDEVEDGLCVQALRDQMQYQGTPEQALDDYNSSMRPHDFAKAFPKTAAKDSKLAFGIDCLPVVPRLVLASDEYVVGFDEKEKAPATWLGEQGVANLAAQNNDSVEETLAKTCHIELQDMNQMAVTQQTPKNPLQEPTDAGEEKTDNTSSAADALKGFFKSVASRAKKLEQTVEKTAKEVAEKHKEQAAKQASQAKETESAGTDKPEEKASAQPETKEKLKGFFSNIVRAVKEEKADLEKSIVRNGKRTRSLESTQTISHQHDDPFDALLKEEKTAEQPSVKQEEKTVPLAAEEPVRQEQEEEVWPPEDQEPVTKSSVALAKATQTNLEVENQEEDLPEEGNLVSEVKLSANEALSVQPRGVPAEETAPVPPAPVKQERPAEPVRAPQPVQEPVAPVTDSKTGKKAVVLFSGGLDSTTCLYWAIAEGYDCEALTIQYGQRHDREVISAQMIARKLGIKQHIITLDLPWLKSSSLVDKSKEIPDVPVEQISSQEIPSTYVPGRNLVFLSLAGSLLDSIGADVIIAGPNAIDFSGYPDCTPAFFKAAEQALNRGTARGVREGIEVLAPLMRLSKADIVKMAAKLQVPFDLTWSCYAGGIKPCGHCDSCKLRAKGFAEAGVRDTSLD